MRSAREIRKRAKSLQYNCKKNNTEREAKYPGRWTDFETLLWIDAVLEGELIALEWVLE